MKYLLLVLSLTFIGTAYAGETKTQCPWMNQSREKILKDPASLANNKKERSRAVRL